MATVARILPPRPAPCLTRRPRRATRGACWVACLCAASLLATAGLRIAAEEIIGPRTTTAEDQATLRDRVSKLAAGLRDPDPRKVLAAAGALAAMGCPLATPYLWQTYNTGDAARRRMALEALGRLKAPGQDAKFVQVSLAEPFLGLRRAAADALVSSSGRDAAAGTYLKVLRDPKLLTPMGRLRAVQLLAHVGGRETAAALKALLADADSDLAGAACEGLALLGDASCLPELLALMGRKQPETSPSAVEALEHLTGQKHRYDLVKWEQWLADWKAGRVELPRRAGGEPRASPPAGSSSAGGTPAAPAAGDGSQPDYGDPYAVPVTAAACDFAIVFDTTGSLAKLWPEVSAPLDMVLAEMAKRTPSLRLGGVRYRADNPDTSLNYLILPKPLTRNIQAARDFVVDASFGGGSGGLHLGLQHAISALNWRAQARRAVLVVGDITPDGDGLARAVKIMSEGWEQDRIQFNCLYIRSQHGEEHRPAYRQMAEAGAGRFYEYDRAWGRLVDQDGEKPGPKNAEPPAVTLEKWLTPVVRKAAP